MDSHNMQFDMETFAEKLEMKIEDIEDSNCVLKEFVLEKLSEFEKKLDEAEKHQESDVTKLREELVNLSDSLAQGSTENLTENTKSSTPVASMSGSRDNTQSVLEFNSNKVLTGCKKIPKELNDVAEEWREKIKPFAPRILDPRDKVSKAQVAYIHYWVHNSSDEVKGSRQDGKCLQHDGLKAGMWNIRFAPEGVTDFPKYLGEKIKTIRRKNRRAEKKKEIDDEYNFVKEVLNDS